MKIILLSILCFNLMGCMVQPELDPVYVDSPMWVDGYWGYNTGVRVWVPGRWDHGYRNHYNGQHYYHHSRK